MATGLRRSSSTFRDLALALSEEERRWLHKRVSESLSLKASDRENRFSSGVSERGRAQLIAEEVRRLGLWDRIRYFLRRLLSTHSDEQAYLDFRINGLRRRARAVCPELAPIERHTVGRAVARHTWELYRAAYAVIPLFLDFWRGGTYLQEAVEFLLAQRIPAAKSNLYDFATLDELQAAFGRNELKGDVRRLVVDRLEAYLDDIPDELFRQLEAGLLPFYYLKQVCLLDYNEFFAVFGFDPGIAPPEEIPPFRDAPMSAALPVVESLYAGLHSAGKLPNDFGFHTEILDRYLEMKEQEHKRDAEGGNAAEEEIEYENRRDQLQRMRDDITRLHEATRTLGRRVPFADLIRFYTRDPWLRIKPYLPELKLREFHRSYLMIRVLGELDSRFPEIRRGVVRTMVRDLFHSEPPPMTHFRTGIQLTPESPTLPDFTHIRSITLTYDFLRFVYRGRMQEMVRTLSRILPVRQRDSSSDLVVHVSGVEQVFADIEDFDESFSPDSEDGKAYYRIRYAVENDVTMQRSYRNIVQQRDRQAASLVERAMEHFDALAAVFDVIQRGLTDQIRERYAEADHRVNSLDGIDQLLEAHGEKVRSFVRLIRQARAIEEGY